MNTLTQNTPSDTPAFLQFNQFESTGIRELTPEEIELINGALCLCKEHLMNSVKAGNKQIIPGMAAGAIGGLLLGPGVVAGAVAGGATGWAYGFTDHLLNGDCPCGV